MFEEFFNICFETFPQISPESKKAVKEIIDTYRETGATTDLFTSYEFDNINQGDVFSEVKWHSYDNDGRIIEKKEKCILLSTTCDAERKDNLVFAAIYPIDEVFKSFNPSRIDEAKKNRLTQYMYLPCSKLENYIIDFSEVFSLPRLLFNKLLDSEIVKKEITLSNEGLYFFIAKFTLAYMRWQDPEINELRQLN